MITTDGLSLVKGRILLENRFLQESGVYMQYLTLISYKSDSILGNPDLDKIINNFMGLLEYCENCEVCEF